MAYRLLHHGLVVVDVWRPRPGIYWLRVFANGEPRWLGIVTEVPGNPSAVGVTNAISRITEHIIQHFQVDVSRLLLYRVWPRGSNGDVGIKRVDVGETVYFKHATRADVKRLLGEELPKIPAHPELYEQVIASGGGIVREIVRDVFEAFHVDALPPPHNPFNCAHIARFRAFKESL